MNAAHWIENEINHLSEQWNELSLRKWSSDLLCDDSEANESSVRDIKESVLENYAGLGFVDMQWSYKCANNTVKNWFYWEMWN